MDVKHDIENKLKESLKPAYLEVVNESHMHNVPANSSTHFRVVAVSARFEGESRVARHQRVYQLLEAEREGPVHALGLHLFTPAEWEARNHQSAASPSCLGGSKAERSH